MLDAATVEVAFFKHRGTVEKAIGTHLDADGKPKTIIFWLGASHRLAVDHAAMIIRIQAMFRAEGKMDKHWTVECLNGIKNAIRNNEIADEFKVTIARRIVAEASELDTPYPVNTKPRPAAQLETIAAKTAKTLHQATRAYIESLERKQLSEAHKDGARHMMFRLRKDWSDLPMSDVDYAWIDALADHFKARPKAKNGKQMKPASVIHILKYARAFLTWADDTKFGGWQAPRKLLKPFRVSVADLMTPAKRRQAMTIHQFDTATLRALYQAANDKTRSWILAGLF